MGGRASLGRSCRPVAVRQPRPLEAQGCWDAFPPALKHRATEHGSFGAGEAGRRYRAEAEEVRGASLQSRAPSCAPVRRLTDGRGWNGTGPWAQGGAVSGLVVVMLDRAVQ